MDRGGLDRRDGLVGGARRARGLGLPARHQPRLSEPRGPGLQGGAGEPRLGGVSSEANEVVRSWNGGWRRYLFPSVWLVYLSQTVDGVHRYSTGPAAIAGYAIIVAFCAIYLTTLSLSWHQQSRAFWPLYAAGAALTTAEYFLARQDASALLIYLAVLTTGSRSRVAPVAVGVLTLVSGLTPALVPSWHRGIARNRAEAARIADERGWL